MTKLSEKIKKIHFSKNKKHLIIALICIMLIGGGLCAFLFRTQIWHTWKADGAYEWSEEWHGIAGHGGLLKGGHWGLLKGWHNPWITGSGAAANTTAFLVWLLGSVVLTVFRLLLAAWLYRAAKRSGMNGWLWAIAGIIFHVFAVALFLIVRSMIREKCPSCGSYQPEKMQYCSKCGCAIHEKCPACGTSCGNGDAFCPSCGKPLHEKED